MNVVSEGFSRSAIEVTVKCSSDDILTAFLIELLAGLGHSVKSFSVFPVLGSSSFGSYVTVYLSSTGTNFLNRCIDVVNRI